MMAFYLSLWSSAQLTEARLTASAYPSLCCTSHNLILVYVSIDGLRTQPKCALTRWTQESIFQAGLWQLVFQMPCLLDWE